MNVATIVIKKISDLQIWEDNPRFISKKKYANLKTEIKEHGFNDIFKLAADGKTILNGNHRLPICKELHIEEVPCIITDAVTDAQKLKIALASNGDYAEYDKDALTELLYKSEIPVDELMSFEIDLGKKTPVLELLSDVGPSFIPDPEEEKPKGHQPRSAHCPECGADFEI